ncbi:MAG: hypothetical protein L6Q81_03520 [Bacteroidia bacterium]|nr:hypothetical protein [Bacteroidia bacterium]
MLNNQFTVNKVLQGLYAFLKLRKHLLALILIIFTFNPGYASSFQMRECSVDENEYRKDNFVCGKYSFAWNRPTYDEKSNLPISNEFVFRLDTFNNDTLIKRIVPPNPNYIPKTYLLDDSCNLWVLFEHVIRSERFIYIQQLDQVTLSPIGSIKAIFSVDGGKSKSFWPFFNIHVRQSDDRSKVLFYTSYYNSTARTFESKLAVYEFSTSLLIRDTILRTSKRIPLGNTSYYMPIMDVTNIGDVYAVGFSDAATEGLGRPHMGRSFDDMVVYKLNSGGIERFEMPRSDKFILDYQIDIWNNNLYLTGACVYGYQSGYQDYGTYLLIHDSNLNESPKIFDYPINKAGVLEGTAEGVKGLIYCKTKITSTGSIWIVTEDVYAGYREFICQYITNEGNLVHTIPIYRLYTNWMTSAQRARMDRSKYPKTTYSILLTNDRLQIFFHDNIGNSCSSNLSNPKELNHTHEQYNLVLAQIDTNGILTKRLITTFYSDQFHQYHYSVMVYTINDTYILRCYQGKGSNDRVKTGYFKL